MKPLLCPYCNKEMSVGYFITDSDCLKWTPIHEKRGILRNRTKVNEILLVKDHFFKPGVLKVFRCDICKKMIIDETDPKP